MNAPRVVVVGAGLAGLACAWRLAQRGLQVDVLESAARPGGRAARTEEEGFSLEGCAPLLSTGDARLLAWIEAVGLRDDLLPLRPVLEGQLHRGRVHPVDGRSLRAAARIPGVRLLHAARLLRLPRLLARYGDRIDPYAPAAAADLDDRSVAEFGELYFGASVRDRWMAPQVASETLAGPDDASRVLFLQRLAAWRGARPGLPRAPLAELPEAAARKLPVQLGVRVEAVRAPVGGRCRIDVPGGALDADAVVIATPADEAARLAGDAIGPAEGEVLRGTVYEPGVTAACALRRSFSTHPRSVRVPAAEGSPLESAVFEPGLAGGGRVPDGHGLVLLRAHGDFGRSRGGEPDEALGKALLDAGAAIQPGLHGAVEFTRVLRVERAAPRFDVGRCRALARFERVQDDLRRRGRRLYFAGDWRVGPAWECAVASGEQAADAVASDLAPTPAARRA